MPPEEKEGKKGADQGKADANSLHYYNNIKPYSHFPAVRRGNGRPGTLDPPPDRIRGRARGKRRGQAPPGKRTYVQVRKG